MLQDLLYFILVLSVVVFVHELGHFLTAKRVGVKVHAFSLGFPPNLVARRWKGTEYRIGLVPLGGYVKMAGENPGEGTGAPDELYSKSKWERAAILVMGPAMNLVLAVGLFTVLFMVGIDRPVGMDDPPRILAVPPDSPAARAGIEAEDTIAEIDGKPIKSWKEALETFYLSPNKTVAVRLDRKGTEVRAELKVEARQEDGAGFTGLAPDLPPEVTRLHPGYPAEKAGLQKGDVIVKVGDEAVYTTDQLKKAIVRTKANEVTLTIDRHGELKEVKVTPVQSGETFLIGIDLPSPVVRERIRNPLTALGAAIKECSNYVRLTFAVLAKLVTRQVSLKQMMGPIGIAKASGEAARAGTRYLFTLMAIISLQLGVFNLLPIPILDGGHIAILMVEGLARRSFSVAIKERILQLGFVLLLLLMVTVLYLDFTKTDVFHNFFR